MKHSAKVLLAISSSCIDEMGPLLWAHYVVLPAVTTTSPYHSLSVAGHFPGSPALVRIALDLGRVRPELAGCPQGGAPRQPGHLHHAAGRHRAAMASASPVLLSGSAIGWYGDRGGNESCNETSGPGSGFLAGLCSAWEGATQPPKAAGIRVTHLRSGQGQSAESGMLGKTLPLYKFGVGGRLGPGTQCWSWISIADEFGASHFLLEAEVAGPVNLTAPEPVTTLD